MTAYDALGHVAEVHLRGTIQQDAAGLYLTDTHGRRWNLQWDDTVDVTR